MSKKMKNESNGRERTIQLGEPMGKTTLAGLVERQLDHLAALKPATDAEIAAMEASARRDVIRGLRDQMGAPAEAVRLCERFSAGSKFVVPPARELTAVENSWWAKKFELHGLLSRTKAGVVVGICGGIGRGKTAMAVALLWEMAEELRSVRYATLTRLLSEVSDARLHGRLTDTLDGYFQPRVLALDGNWYIYGRTSQVDFVRSMLEERTASGRKTILVGDEPPDLFDEGIGAKMADRINRNGATVVATWPAFEGGEL